MEAALKGRKAWWKVSVKLEVVWVAFCLLEVEASACLARGLPAWSERLKVRVGDCSSALLRPQEVEEEVVQLLRVVEAELHPVIEELLRSAGVALVQRWWKRFVASWSPGQSRTC